MQTLELELQFPSKLFASPVLFSVVTFASSLCFRVGVVVEAETAGAEKGAEIGVDVDAEAGIEGAAESWHWRR